MPDHRRDNCDLVTTEPLTCVKGQRASHFLNSPKHGGSSIVGHSGSKRMHPGPRRCWNEWRPWQAVFESCSREKGTHAEQSDRLLGYPGQSIPGSIRLYNSFGQNIDPWHVLPERVPCSFPAQKGLNDCALRIRSRMGKRSSAVDFVVRLGHYREPNPTPAPPFPATRLISTPAYCLPKALCLSGSLQVGTLMASSSLRSLTREAPEQV